MWSIYATNMSGCKVINKLFICFGVQVADFVEIGEMKGNRFLYQFCPKNISCYTYVHVKSW